LNVSKNKRGNSVFGKKVWVQSWISKKYGIVEEIKNSKTLFLNKSRKFTSKKIQKPLFLTKLDEIVRLVRDLAIFD